MKLENWGIKVLRLFRLFIDFNMENLNRNKNNKII